MFRAVVGAIKALLATDGSFAGFSNAGVPVPVPYAVLQSGIGIGIPSSGTIGANGALTLTTALPVTYTQGLYLYYPANSIGAGVAAGLYWTVMSSTTVGTIFNNVHAGNKPVAPAAPTAFSGTVGGIYVQDLTEITLQNINITGGSLGVDGQIRMTVVGSASNNANAKTYRNRFGGSAMMTQAITTANMYRIESHIAANGVSRQKNAASNIAYTPNVTGPSSVTFTNVNTAVDQSLAHTMQLAVATDFIVIEYIRVEVFNQ